MFYISNWNFLSLCIYGPFLCAVCRMWPVFCKNLKLLIFSLESYLNPAVRVSQWVKSYFRSCTLSQNVIGFFGLLTSFINFPCFFFFSSGNLCRNTWKHSLFPWHLCYSQPKGRLVVCKHLNYYYFFLMLCAKVSNCKESNSLCGHSAVLLLLLGDADPPTLLETSRWFLHFFFLLVKMQIGERQTCTIFHYVCRLLLTCLSHKDVCSLWIQRIRQQTSVCPNLCFIMSSSTNSMAPISFNKKLNK